MRRVWVLLVFSLVASVLGSQGTVWKPYKSKEGRFSASFPGIPATMKIPLEDSGMKLDIHSVFAPSKNQGAYIVMFVDLPADNVAASEPQVLMDRFLDLMMTRRQCTLLSRRDISTTKAPAREFAYKDPKGLVGLSRIYLSGRRFYMPILLYRQGQPVPSDLDRFFDSFKIQ